MKINLLARTYREMVKRGWFYLRIDSVVVANDVMPIESDL